VRPVPGPALATLVIAIAQAAAAPAAEPALPEGVRATRLENGLRVITKEAFDRDLVALNLYVDGGNRTEPPELSGLSHYYEHLIFRGGSKAQKELECRKAFMALGELSGYTTSDLTCYNFTVPSASFDAALGRFADAVLDLEVTDPKVQKEREVVLSEFKMSYADSPRGWAWYNLMGAAFKTHPYGRTTIGRRDVLESADLPRLKSFYEERYVPNHMVVVVVGAIRHDDAARKVAAAFGSRPRGRESFEVGAAEPPQEATRVVVEGRESEKSYVFVGFKAPGALAKDAPALSVLATILGGGESSRLEREVRARKRLALEASAWFDDCKDPSLLGVFVQVEPGKEAEALAAAADEIARLKAEDVPADELARARNQIEKAWIYGGERYIDQAQRLGWFAVVGDPNLGADYLEKIRAVSAADVRAAARRHLASRQATISAVVPKDARRPEGLGEAVSRVDANAPAAAAAPGAAAGPKPRQEVRRTESGGLLLAREARSSPVVAVVVRHEGGIAHELAPGEAALWERLALRGAGERDREAFAREMDRLGVRLAASVDRDGTDVTLVATEDTFEAGLDLLADVILRPRVDPEEVEKARTEQVAAIQALDDSSFDLAAEASYAALYPPGHPYARPLRGTVESVRAATREGVLAFGRRAVLAAKRHIAIVGAVDPTRALDSIDRRGLGRRKEPGQAAEAAPAALARTFPALNPRPREQVAFRLAHAGIPARHADYFPLQLAVRHLGTQLFFRYVYEEGIAYRMWVYQRGGLKGHPFTFEMGVSAPNYKKARAGLEAALTDLVSKGLTEDDLAKARDDFLTRFLLGQETSLAQASLLASYEALGLGHEAVDALPGRIREIPLERVNQAARTHLQPEKLVLAAVGDLEAAGVEEGKD